VDSQTRDSGVPVVTAVADTNERGQGQEVKKKHMERS
jgi:hypothetical protein